MPSSVLVVDIRVMSVALEHLPQHAASRVRTGGQDQRTTGRRQAGLNCVQDLDVRICVGCVHIPEGKLVGDHSHLGLCSLRFRWPAAN